MSFLKYILNSKIFCILIVVAFCSINFAQESVTEPKKSINSDFNTSKNRFPEYEPYFKKPKNTGKDEVITVKHPDSAKGLLKIQKDGTYVYRPRVYEKDRAGTLKFGGMLPPTISDSATGVSFEKMYGKSNIIGFYLDYEWQFLQSAGKMGFIFGTGISTSTGRGTMVRTGEVGQAQESYLLLVIPATVLLNYRFEYSDNQWVVPFANAGGTYFGLVENRDDNKRYFAGAPAASVGGGIHISMTKWDHENRFRLANEYNIADLWMTLEGRVLKGLNQNLDFTTNIFSLGITADFK